MATQTKEVKNRRSTSLPLLIGFLILGGLGYAFGEKIMTYIFYLQEVRISDSMTIQSKGTNGKEASLASPDNPATEAEVTSGSVPPRDTALDAATENPLRQPPK